MTTFLSAAPVLCVILALVAGMRSLNAALLGGAVACLAILAAFPVPLDSIAPAALRWTPILAEVLLIVGGGLLLSEVLRQAGGQAALAAWVKARQQRVGASAGPQDHVGPVLLVVHGVTPFAESLTGFGIGVTIGIPLLAHFGLSPVRVAVIGLLGLCAVPWGSMGPGTLIAAGMSGLSFDQLGVASAVVSLVPFVVVGMIAAALAAGPGGRGAALAKGALSGLVLSVLVAGANLGFGTAPAGALGALAMIALHLGLRRAAPAAAPLGAVGRRAMASYVVLLGGVLAAGAMLRLTGAPEGARYLASPALWLFVAAAWFARGRIAPQAGLRAWQGWRQVAPVTGAFILLGVLMAVSGMAAHLARALAGVGPAYLAIAPYVAAGAGFITGSNSGANAMFAATQAEIAQSLGVDLLAFMAVHNVAASFLLMASPGKVELAVQLAPAGAASGRRAIQAAMLVIAFITVTVLAILNLALGLM